jgi:hypothetical protein
MAFAILGRIVLTWMTGVLLFATCESAGAEPRRVLLLHSFGPYFAP